MFHLTPGRLLQYAAAATALAVALVAAGMPAQASAGVISVRIVNHSSTPSDVVQAHVRAGSSGGSCPTGTWTSPVAFPSGAVTLNLPAVSGCYYIADEYAGVQTPDLPNWHYQGTASFTATPAGKCVKETVSGQDNGYESMTVTQGNC